MELDSLEYALIEALRRNAARSDRELASDLGENMTDVEAARERLEERGVIESYSAVIDPPAVGLDTLSYHLVGATDNYDETLADGLPTYNAWGGTQLVMVVLGQYDLIIRKVSEDSDAFSRFARNIIENTNTPGFTRRETYRVDERYRWNGQNISEDKQYGVSDPVDTTEIRRNVLNTLVRDGRLRRRHDQLAERVGEPVSDVTAAVETLEQRGVITGYTANVSFDTLGWYRAFLGLSAVQGGYKSSIDRLLQFDPFRVPYIVSGTGFNWLDIGVELVFESIEMLDDLTDEIRTECDARESQTLLSTKVFQDDRNVPFDDG